MRLSPGNCAKLAELLAIAEAELCTEEEEPRKEASETYAALFRALALGGLTTGYLRKDSHQMMIEDLETLGLGGLLAPRPDGTQREVTQ